jgi:hypothetical protein
MVLPYGVGARLNKHLVAQTTLDYIFENDRDSRTQQGVLFSAWEPSPVTNA